MLIRRLRNGDVLIIMNSSVFLCASSLKACGVKFIGRNSIHVTSNEPQFQEKPRFVISDLSDCRRTQVCSHLICKRTLNYSDKKTEYDNYFVSNSFYGPFNVCLDHDS